MSEQRFRLRSSEWLLTGSLILLLFSLYAIAKIKAYQCGSPIEKKVVYVDVTIEGHVAKPGVYSVARGASVEGALRKAKPLKFADLRAISWKEPIAAPMRLNIEKLKEIAIRVEGAVQKAGIVRVSPGTKISDLKKILSLEAEADLTIFKKKRQLTDGETVKIPFRER